MEFDVFPFSIYRFDDYGPGRASTAQYHRTLHTVVQIKRPLNKYSHRAGESPDVTVYTATAEHVNLGPSTHVRQLIMACDSRNRGSSSLYWAPQVTILTRHHTHLHVIKNKINLKTMNCDKTLKDRT